MNKRERVLAAIENREADHVPVGFWFHFTPNHAHGEASIEAHLKWYHESDEDFVKIMSDGYFGYPNETLKGLTDWDELYEMKPLGKDHPYIREQIERAKAIADEVKEECCIFYNIFCPLSLFRLQVGWNRMMECAKTNPEALKYACGIIAEDTKELVKGILEEAKCDGIYYCVQNAEENRFTKEEYENMVKPYDLKVLTYANTLSSHNILHCCGWEGIKNYMDLWEDYPAAAINWAVYVEQLDIEAGRNVFQGRPALGGFDNHPDAVLNSGTEQEIKNFTRRLIEANGKKGFMIGADCSIPKTIDPQHVRWVIEQSRSM